MGKKNKHTHIHGADSEPANVPLRFIPSRALMLVAKVMRGS
jgi:hypothetical protein